MGGDGAGIGLGGIRHGARARSRGGPGGSLTAVEHGASRGTDQPPEDDQADHVWPRRVRAAASPSSGSSMNEASAPVPLHRECGRTSRAVRVLGAVRSPGRYEWSDEMSLLDL